MITIVKPIPNLHTTAKNETTYTNMYIKLLQQKSEVRLTKSYRVPPISCLASLCRTSISIMAASRYLLIDRTILIATTSFFSLSKHSKTCPNVPEEKQKQKWLLNFVKLRKDKNK